MDNLYYYYTYSPELGGRKLNTKIYSDTTVSLLDLARQEGLSPSPTLSSINPTFRTELSRNWLITTAVAQQQVNRVVHYGDFTFSGFELTGGSIRESIIVFSDGTIQGKTYSAPVLYQEMVSAGAYKAISTFSGQSFTSLGSFSQFFPSGWANDPFGPNLISATTTTIATPSATATVNALPTTSNVDGLTGVAKKKDIFQFSANPGFGERADVITGFSAKEKDSIQIFNQAFGFANGIFAIAKKPKSLARLLASEASFIYNQSKGEMILNANGAEPGFGADGGVFALLVGNPKLATSSVLFV